MAKKSMKKSSRMPKLRCSGRIYRIPLSPFQQIEKCVIKCWMKTLFFWRCGSCDYETQMVYSCLYQDKIRKFMIYVQPKDEDPAVLKANFRIRFEIKNALLQILKN